MAKAAKMLAWIAAIALPGGLVAIAVWQALKRLPK
jgi:hypothetical protein